MFKWIKRVLIGVVGLFLLILVGSWISFYLLKVNFTEKELNSTSIAQTAKGKIRNILNKAHPN